MLEEPDETGRYVEFDWSLEGTEEVWVDFGDDAREIALQYLIDEVGLPWQYDINIDTIYDPEDENYAG